MSPSILHLISLLHFTLLRSTLFCFPLQLSEGYDGAQLANIGGVIVVTVAFRLNVWGHLGSSALKVRASDGSAGNWGIQD